MTDIPKISCAFANEAALYMAYMPFVKNGGLFIRNQDYSFGSEVELTLNLWDEQEAFIIQGKVIWVTPKAAQGDKLPGIGLQFLSENKTVVTNMIEKHLAGMINSSQLSDTM